MVQNLYYRFVQINRSLTAPIVEVTFHSIKFDGCIAFEMTEKCQSFQSDLKWCTKVLVIAFFDLELDMFASSLCSY